VAGSCCPFPRREASLLPLSRAATRSATRTCCHAVCHAEIDGLRRPVRVWDGRLIRHFSKQSKRIGAPDRVRTCGLRLRRPSLYPAELRARGRDRALAYPIPTLMVPKRGSLPRGRSDPDLRRDGMQQPSGTRDTKTSHEPPEANDQSRYIVPTHVQVLHNSTLPSRS
jgi:hypothetical protein